MAPRIGTISAGYALDAQKTVETRIEAHDSPYSMALHDRA
jgi:hypothetical protein